MRASRQTPFRPECECLEDRAVPATHLSASFSGGVLRIEGTNHADLILVAENHNRIWVAHSTIRVHSHQQASIEASAVKKIEILGLGGNDTISLDPRQTGGRQPITAVTFIWGGTGNDVIHGGAGPNFIWGGRGNDVIYGGAGNDHIWGGRGNNTIVDLAGHNWLIGGAGNDHFIVSNTWNYIDGGHGRNSLTYRVDLPRAELHAWEARSVHNIQIIVGPVHRHAAHPHAAHLQNPGLTSTPVRSAAIAPVAQPFAAQVAQFLVMLNQYRNANNLNPLSLDSRLVAAAQMHADYMAATGDYAHVTQDGQDVTGRLALVQYPWLWVGENIHVYDPNSGYTWGIDQYYAPSEIANYFFDGWRVSPEHNANMLAPFPTEVGMAMSQAADGKIYAVLVLADPA
jgi:uncharacterized protein YkwD